MAITTAMCTSFKVELLQALHDFDSGANSFKIGLFKTAPAGTYDASTTNYSTVTGNSDEHGTPTGYTTGGTALTNVTPTSTTTTAFTDFSQDITWGTSTFTSDGAFIYNATNSNRMVSVHDFGGPKQSTAGDFVIQFPSPTSTTAIIRIA